MANHQQIVATTARSWFWRAAVAALAEGLMSFPSMFRMRETKEKKNPFLHLLFVLRPVPKFCRESSAFSSVCIFTTSLTLERFWFCRASLETKAVVFGCKASFLGLGVGADLMHSTQPGPSGRSAPAKHGMDPHHHRELWAGE